MKLKKIKMFKNGEWVKWDGSDVPMLIIEEEMSLSELEVHYPKKHKEFSKRNLNRN